MMADEVENETPELSPRDRYDQALLEAYRARIGISRAFAAAVSDNSMVGIIDPAVEAKLPDGEDGDAGRAKLAELRALWAAIRVDGAAEA